MTGHPGINRIIWMQIIEPDILNGRFQQISYLNFAVGEWFDLMTSKTITREELANIQWTHRDNPPVTDFVIGSQTIEVPRTGQIGPIFPKLITSQTIVSDHFRRMEQMEIKGVPAIKLRGVTFYSPGFESGPSEKAFAVVLTKEGLGIRPDGTLYPYATMTKDHLVVPDTKTRRVRLKERLMAVTGRK